MQSDAWPQYCRAALVQSVARAAAQFPGVPAKKALRRVHDVRKTLKEARAIARLFLHCVRRTGSGHDHDTRRDASPDRPGA